MRQRFVMIGDSLTREWLDRHPAFFESLGIVNAGICGQTTGQIAARFANDALTPRRDGVFIMAGTNDIAGNDGAVADDVIVRLIGDMAEAARAAATVPVICSLPPANAFFWQPGPAPGPRIEALNARLRTLCRTMQVTYADYHDRLCDDHGGLKPSFTDDGVHLTAAGYAAIAPVAASIMETISATQQTRPSQMPTW